MPNVAKVSHKKREKKVIPVGKANIQATFNNTIVTITDLNGNVVSWSSSGAQGFKGSRKSTPYAASVAGEAAMRKALEHGMRQVDVFVKGPGSGRESAISALKGGSSGGLVITSIVDVTPLAHNGCRAPKRRRV